MNDIFSFSYPRYLEAKKTVDDRSLNRTVWTSFLEGIAQMGASIRLLEVGGGTGATLLRWLQAFRELPVTECTYLLVDERPENLDTARSRIQDWVANRDTEAVWHENEVTIHLENPAQRLCIRFEASDLLDLRGENTTSEQFDAVIAQAVLDLFDVPEALRHLNAHLRTGGLWYLPIHYDGQTTFEPGVDPTLDRRVERCYHDSMKSPHSGRQILTSLRSNGSELREVGASDWIVYATKNGYPYQEEYFLRCILSFVESEMMSCPDMSNNETREWIDARTSHLDDKSLIYMAHQLDICAEKA